MIQQWIARKKDPANKKNHAPSSAEIDLAFRADLFGPKVCPWPKDEAKEKGEMRTLRANFGGRVVEKILPYGSWPKRSAICLTGRTLGVKFQVLTSELSPKP